MSETIERSYPEALALRSVANHERDHCGRNELATVLESAADSIDRLSSDLESATKSLKSHSAVVIDQHTEILRLQSQLNKAVDAMGLYETAVSQAEAIMGLDDPRFEKAFREMVASARKARDAAKENPK